MGIEATIYEVIYLYNDNLIFPSIHIKFHDYLMMTRIHQSLTKSTNI